ncbi:O-antigen ligase family protein [Halioxenophilus sp. WMMB6]|uniref:O-antigen ligase family protein n=1 Tax=Halioxenophilus sp. WMMB6 TaxID=3073815 RepID=UPI00295E4432|nr:O-antigen ligase family protein [Halioxenophilus sp. WMMB6]
MQIQSRQILSHDKIYYPGLVLVFIYGALYLTLDTLPGYASKLLVLFTAYAVLTRKSYTQKQAILWLFYGTIVLQLISWGATTVFLPHMADPTSPKVNRMGAWFMLIPIAFFTRHHTSHPFILWSIALLALLLTPWSTGGGNAEILRALHHERIDFNLRNAEHMGMLFGTGVIGLTAFSYRCLILARKHKLLWLTPLYLLAWLATLLAVLASQTRAVWFSLAITLACGFIWLVWRAIIAWREGNRRTLRLTAYSLAVAVAVIGIFSVLFADVVQTRIDEMEPTKLINLVQNPEQAAEQSVRVRLATWQEALRWIRQRPVLGWGGKGRAAVVQATSQLNEQEKQGFNHLHNSYLDIAVNFGVAGLVLLFLLLGYITRTVYQRVQSGGLASDLLLFWCLFLVYWLIVNLFESYMFFGTGSYALGIIAGGVLSLCWKTSTPGTEETDSIRIPAPSNE